MAEVEAVRAKLGAEQVLTGRDRALVAAAQRRLIVYGSLAPGGPNHSVLADVGGTWWRGWITGELVAGGWGSGLGYDALVWSPHGTGQAIAAHLLESDALPARWHELDEFEGGAYRRISIPFLLEDGGAILGQVYAQSA